VSAPPSLEARRSHCRESEWSQRRPADPELTRTHRFSASKFWKEARETNATVVQYIGELCRYLLSKDEAPEDKQHRVRVAYGNGLRPDIWKQFKKRFNISVVQECVLLLGRFAG
jgi:acyl-CoA synthetase (AMP-forming)/AMP-acid ligase II